VLRTVSEPTVDQVRAILEQQESRPGDGATVFVFAKGEEVPADHPAVLARPDLFDPEPVEE
jgi:hypothetical protein